MAEGPGRYRRNGTTANACANSFTWMEQFVIVGNRCHQPRPLLAVTRNRVILAAKSGSDGLSAPLGVAFLSLLAFLISANRLRCDNVMMTGIGNVPAFCWCAMPLSTVAGALKPSVAARDSRRPFAVPAHHMS